MNRYMYTCSTSHPTALERVDNNQLNTPPMIPGNASNAFNPSFFSKLDRFLRFCSIYSFTPLLPGAGGIGAGMGLTLAMIESIDGTDIDVNILTIVTPCSLNKV